MIDESLKETASLTLQSKYLRRELLLCIEHNQNIVLREAPVYNEASVLLEAVKEHEQCLKYMLVFFDEVNVLKSLQGQAFIPWAFRVVNGNNNNNNSSSSSYSSSDDSPVKEVGNRPPDSPPVELKRVSIQRRLKKITKMRQFLEKNVMAIETKYEKVSTNLSQCRKTLKALEGKLRRLSSLGIYENPFGQFVLSFSIHFITFSSYLSNRLRA
mmetsp:Transcript_30696/g.44037  ORF Transcript_30696/g.44037 Transcript_30696/m.44037 type:complete len:213 (+) Transcript_30696:275-913(+)